ncbi:truncated transcription factor CAULIFLOWER A-like isoform X2 [Lycium ferocissimum]|uniref:truncated transcription factor CAULIFLOWER A-like isoform X2 n=1 Tax=Lycium ferocissimum TaxID=112874 RepID=UPI002814BE6E|nr:truncated transcription factor CAULIFLOWER A-like isoform X2 [Lycium ferocissimum]
MGRRKVEIKRIQDKNSRQVAFCKRRKGLLKKAKALSILCDVDVAAVIFSNSGRLHEFSNTNSVTGILQRYKSHVEAEKEISAEIQVAEHSKYSRFMTVGELLQRTERQLEETNADGLTVTDLIHWENELQTAIIQIRSRKTNMMLESVKGLHKKIARIKKNRKKMATDFTDLPPPHIICGQQRVTLNFF